MFAHAQLSHDVNAGSTAFAVSVIVDIQHIFGSET